MKFCLGRPWLPFVAILGLLSGAPARGIAAEVAAGSQPPNATPGTPEIPATPGASQALLKRDFLLGDWGGLRTRLADRGIAFSLIYTGEEFGNPVGGARRGQVYDGLATAGLDVDVEKLTKGAWKGLQLHALAYAPHGASGTDKYTRDLGRFSNIDAYDSIRLFELWLDQSAFGGQLSVRVGQLAVDAEFATTDPGTLFVNSDFGALPTFALNMPVPAYPIAAPGVRLRLSTKDERFYFQGGAYDGNPNPDTVGDPSPGFQPGTTYDRSGTRINLNSREGAFLIGQLGFRLNRRPGDKGLPGTYRVGAFYHTDTFSDNRRDNLGFSLADPRSTGIARARHGNYGAYLAADQNVFVAPGATPISGPGETPASAPVGNAEDAASSGNIPTAPPDTGGRAASVFLRLGLAPDDRNLSPFYLDAGFNFRGLLPGRPKDVFGVAFAYLAISDSRRQVARDRNRFTGTRDALPDHEIVWEATYQVNLTPWLQIQPDLQYIVHPGGSAQFDDALVLGVRSVVIF